MVSTKAPGAFSDDNASIEEHLSRIESDAAVAIQRFVSAASGNGATPSPAVWRFLSWQAARTPGSLALLEKWANDPTFWDAATVEPPPEGFATIADRQRPHCVENPETGERRQVFDAKELRAYQQQGWEWRLSPQDKLESLHMQAWYFQVRHFARLKWARLDCPDGEHFVTSDRAVAWLADGFADTPPSALRHPTAQLIAPLTSKTVLVGRHSTERLRVTPREVNRLVAFAASAWIAGPTRFAVEQAISDRAAVASC